MTRDVPIERILVTDRLRDIDPSWVEALAASFEDKGQSQSIVVRQVAGTEEGYELVAGAHRFAAAQRLGWATIRADVHAVGALDDFGARLIEIDENLMRRELSALDRAVFLAERKTVWESIHAETGHGKAKKPKKSDIEGKVAKLATFARFSFEAAERTGLSERTVRRATELAAHLDREAIILLRGTDLVDNQAQLQRLAREPASVQVAIARQIRDGQAATIGAARLNMGLDTPIARDPVNEAFLKLVDAWSRAPAKARRQFLSHVGAVPAAASDEIAA